MFCAVGKAAKACVWPLPLSYIDGFKSRWSYTSIPLDAFTV
jgi:hypothetical protein